MELDPPHPLFADDIIADRVLFGDATAADQLYSIYRSLEDSGKRSEVLPTVEYYLLKNCSLEQTAEHMVVHPNTVRYRLHKAMELRVGSNEPQGSTRTADRHQNRPVPRGAQQEFYLSPGRPPAGQP